MREEQERERRVEREPDAGEPGAPAGIPEGTPPHTTDDDVRALRGVGGAMTARDRHPHLLGEVDAGEIRLPLMEEESERRARPAPAPDEEVPDEPPGAEPGAQL